MKIPHGLSAIAFAILFIALSSNAKASTGSIVNIDQQSTITIINEEGIVYDVLNTKQLEVVEGDVVEYDQAEKTIHSQGKPAVDKILTGIAITPLYSPVKF